MSINEFIDYLSLEKNYSIHTVSAYRRDLETFFDFCLENYGMDSIDEMEYPVIRSWVVDLVNSGISNRTINRKIASLKAYYRFLQRIDKIQTNPLAKHKALKTPKKVEVPFSEDEILRLLTQNPFENTFEGKRDRLIIELLYVSGMRRSELIDLKINNVDLEKGSLKVLGKRNKERILPLLPSTRPLFKDYFEARNSLAFVAEDSYVFLTKSGNKIYETLVYRIINGYFSKVSSKTKKSPHILRHTFATHMLNHGADLNSVKELLGHSSLASTQVYTHNSIAELKKIHASAHPRNKK
ncbi:tyrosine-type recombinase/integrase [Maribacter algicola]|uniref:Tyrosine-type recombinase/integrase n=1 Tax=Meishania litoralis TaxID=3434685 RepID=A0ACC7LM21_9FLAO